ncbi:DUF2971 domain-containing protein [Paenibacillus xylanexedens]|uniref:DUF2971 domain-containing protein n=1 Tax=Paenibacillus xylanexedens TaxID=528191 RepID=UPI003B0211AF
MAYTHEEWNKRVKSRSDLSGYLYHLTKAEVDKNGKITLNVIDRLMKIINERRLIGSSTESGFITGDRKAVCFQDTPIGSLMENIVHEKDYRDKLGGKIRYVSIGLAFPKPYIFQNGGRPVFYESKEVAKQILPKTEWWRIVDYNLMHKNYLIDWTHEREWRLPLDEFIFELSKVTIILPNQQMFLDFMDKISQEDLKQIQGIVQTSIVIF